jgi:hypothetical protein
MSSKGTPKKVYTTKHVSIDPSSCRLCRAVGDASHWKNIFKPSNRPLLIIAEALCGEKLIEDASCPHLLCRPCERRLKNTTQFRNVIVETQKSLRESHSCVKRCVEVSPSVPIPPAKKSPALGDLSSVKGHLAFHFTDLVKELLTTGNTTEVS